MKPGLVYEDANVKVTAFQNAHGEWRQTYGYQFKTADRTIVISGDTNPSAAPCGRALPEMRRPHPRGVRQCLQAGGHGELAGYRARNYHTTTLQLAEIANRSQPGDSSSCITAGWDRPATRFPTHSTRGDRPTYRGKVVVGQDLDIG